MTQNIWITIGHPEALNVAILSFGFFTGVQYVTQQLLSRTKVYQKLPQFSTREQKGKLAYENLFVSMVHAMIVCPLAMIILLTQHSLFEHNFMFSSSQLSRFLTPLSAGYFIWDTVHCLRFYREFGASFLFHGIACGVAYVIASVAPYYHYYGASFLMFEVSTLFLNMQIFFDVHQYKGKWVHVNSLCFALSFFIFRNVIGGYFAFRLMHTSFVMRSQMQLASGVLLVSLVCMTSLNIYWLNRIIKRARRIMNSPPSSPQTGHSKSH